MEMSIGLRPSCVGLRLLNLHALQFVIVLRVIIVHFGCYLMKHLQAFLYSVLSRFYSSCQIVCKGNDFN